MICMVKIRFLEYDEHYAVRGETLKRAIDEDIQKGLIPFYVSCHQCSYQTEFKF